MPPPPLTDPGYFDYFKDEVNNDGSLYDKFVESWYKLELNEIGAVVHWNMLNVLTLMLEKRTKTINDFNSVLASSREKDTVIKRVKKEKSEVLKQKNTEIEVLLQEKSEALKDLSKENSENFTLKQRIEELGGLWVLEQTKNKDVENKEIADLKERIKTLEEDVEFKNGKIEKYRKQRNDADYDLDKALKKVKKVEGKFATLEADAEALEAKNKQLEADLNDANKRIKEFETQLEEYSVQAEQYVAVKNEFKQLQNEFKEKEVELNKAKAQLEQLDCVRNELNQVKAYLKAKETELSNVKTQLGLAVLKEERSKHFEETNPLQMAQIEVEQLQQALNCATDQNQKLQNELNAARNELHEKQEKAAALKELFRNTKICDTKSLKKLVPKLPTLANDERINLLEKENLLLSDENVKLKSELEAASKRRNKLDAAAEKRKRSLEEQQLQQNGDGSKRARQEPPFFSSMTNLGHQGPVACSPPRIVSLPDLSPQHPELGPQQSFGISQQQNVFSYSRNQLNQAQPNMTQFQQNDPTFSHQLQQHFFQHRQMMLQRYPHFSNQIMPATSNNHRELPSPIQMPEMMPPNVQQMSQEQMQIYLRNYQQQQQNICFPAHMIPIPPVQQQPLQPYPHHQYPNVRHPQQNQNP